MSEVPDGAFKTPPYPPFRHPPTETASPSPPLSWYFLGTTPLCFPALCASPSDHHHHHLATTQRTPIDPARTQEPRLWAAAGDLGRKCNLRSVKASEGRQDCVHDAQPPSLSKRLEFLDLDFLWRLFLGSGAGGGSVGVGSPLGHGV